MNQASASFAARWIAASAFAPIQIGGVGFCAGLSETRTWSSVEMRALHRHLVLSPEPLDRFQVLEKPRHTVLRRRAESLELHLAIAEPGAEGEAPAGHHIEGGELLGEVEWLVQRQQHDAGDQPQVRRLPHDAGEERYLLELLQRIAGEMLALHQAVEAELVGPARLVQLVLGPLHHVVALRILRPHADAVAHLLGLAVHALSSFLDPRGRLCKNLRFYPTRTRESAPSLCGKRWVGGGVIAPHPWHQQAS